MTDIKLYTVGRVHNGIKLQEKKHSLYIYNILLLLLKRIVFLAVKFSFGYSLKLKKKKTE